MHKIEIIEPSAMDSTRFVYINGVAAKIRSLKIESDISSRITKVIIEVYHIPYIIVGDDCKTYTWELSPCKVIANLPGIWYNE
jgi:hypothetical protein